MPLTLEPLPPREAIDYLKVKGYQVGFAWQDVYAEEHAKAFTAAKMMRVDLLQTVHEHVVQAIQEGKSLRDFAAELTPILKQSGWWGRQEMTDPATGKTKKVQLGSPSRLQTIYDVNLRTAYSVGRYQRAQRSKSLLPYLVYRSMRDARVRPAHAAWNGTLLPQDHPWWDTHYPPNGWRCRCIAYPLSEQDAANYPGAQRGDPSTETTQWVNPRTGEVRDVPVGIDPGFDYHPGKAALRPLIPPPLDTPPAGAAAHHAVPPVLPSTQRGAPLLPPGLTDQEYAAAFLARFGATVDSPAIYRDVLDEPLVMGKELFQDGRGEWKANKQGRGRYLLLLAEAITDPDEIWLHWEEMRANPGRWLLRRRYIKAFDLGDAQFGLAMFEWGRYGWRGATIFAPTQATDDARRAYIEKQRAGELIYQRKE